MNKQRKEMCYQKINLTDYLLFMSVMRNKEAYTNVLNIIMGRDDIVLKDIKVEEIILNEEGSRAIRLDAWAVDTEDSQYAVEMQNDSDTDFIPKRARFYQGLIDSPILKSGKETRYKYLPKTYIIFITQADIFGGDRAGYFFENRCRELPGLTLEDEAVKIFLNTTSKNGEPALVSLLQYMKNTNIENPEIILKDERIIRLDEIVREVKQSEEWEVFSMGILEESRRLGVEFGVKQGIEQGVRQGIEQGVRQGIEQGVRQGIEQGVKQGIERGLEEGSKRKIIELIQIKKNRGLTAEETAGLLEQDIQYVEQVYNIMEEHPEYTPKDICEQHI